MYKALEKEIRKYKKRIKALLICDSKMAKSYLDGFENNIADFVENSGASSMQEIIAHFGEPEVVARAFFETADIRKVKRRINIKRVVIVGFLTAVVVWAVAVTCLAIDAYTSNHGYSSDVVSEEIITYPLTNG